MVPLTPGGGEIHQQVKVTETFSLKVSGFRGKLRVTGSHASSLSLRGRYTGNEPLEFRFETSGRVGHLQVHDPDTSNDVLSDQPADNLDDTAEMHIYQPISGEWELSLPLTFLRHLRIEGRGLAVSVTGLHWPMDTVDPLFVVDLDGSSGLLLRDLEMHAGTLVALCESGNIGLSEVRADRLYVSSQKGHLSAERCHGHLEFYAVTGSGNSTEHVGTSIMSGLGLLLERGLADGESLKHTSRGRQGHCLLPFVTLPYVWDF